MKIQTALADTSYQAAPGSGFACARQPRTAPHLTIPALQIASTSTETASVSSEAHDPCEHLLRKHTQQKHMASNNPSSNLERAAEAADDFEKKHYQGGELDAQDFKKAGENATAAVSNAATAVKEAVVGPADPKVCLSIIVRKATIAMVRARSARCASGRYLPISTRPCSTCFFNNFVQRASRAVVIGSSSIVAVPWYGLHVPLCCTRF
jgi:hypothetical protein